MDTSVIFKIVSKNADEMINLIEIILRHEIGHMISMAMIHEGISMEESNAIDENIKILENDMLSKMNNDISYEEQASLPMEAHANKCANVNVSKLIELSYRFDQL